MGQIVKIGICPICHKEFKLTKPGFLYRHGYKRELRQRTWHGIITFIKRYYILISPACPGSGLLPVKTTEFIKAIKKGISLKRSPCTNDVSPIQNDF